MRVKVAGAAKALGGCSKLFCVVFAAVALVVSIEATPLSQDAFAQPQAVDFESPQHIVQGDPYTDTTPLTQEVVAETSAAEFEPPQHIVRGNPDRAEVALTFDCGPWVDRSYVTAILDALEQTGTRVTFFVTGQFIEKNGDIFARIARQHEVANHSYTHPNFSGLRPGDQTNELQWTEQLINSYGASSGGLWRSPFGAFNNEVIGNAAYSGFPRHIYWTFDSADWQPAVSPAVVHSRVVNGASNGAIVVQHCNSRQTAMVLPAILAGLQNRGFGVTTVSALLR